MKLTPAEDWAEKGSYAECSSDPDFYRQIQADALRFVVSELENLARRNERMQLIDKIANLSNIANQLHPLTESKPELPCNSEFEKRASKAAEILGLSIEQGRAFVSSADETMQRLRDSGK